MRTDRLARLHGATDAKAGEAVRIRPQTVGGYVAGGTDSARPPATITGYVALIPAAVRTQGQGARGGDNAALRLSADTVKFATAALPYAVAAGDLVDLLERDGEPTYRVSRVHAFSAGRTVLYMTPAGAA